MGSKASENIISKKKKKQKNILGIHEWSERSEMKAGHISSMPFCSIMGSFRWEGTSVGPWSNFLLKARASSQMRPGCSGLYPVTAQPLWTTCSHAKMLSLQLSYSKAAFSSGEKKTPNKTQQKPLS